MTKKEMYMHIAEINANDSEIVAFCNHEIELLDRKVTGPRKPTNVQIENEKFKHGILEVLANADRPLTITEIMAEAPLNALTNQRVSALVTQLKKAGLVVRIEEKRKAYFSLAQSENPKLQFGFFLTFLFGIFLNKLQDFLARSQASAPDSAYYTTPRENCQAFSFKK